MLDTELEYAPKGPRPHGERDTEALSHSWVSTAKARFGLLREYV